IDGLEVTVRDLDSRNGTYVNDERVKSCKLAAGFQVRFGNVSFVVELNGARQSVETRSLDDAISVPALNIDTPVPLSPAERRVLDLLLQGDSERQAARRLGVSQHTVHNHIREIYRQLGVHSRAELMAQFVRPSEGQTSSADDG